MGIQFNCDNCGNKSEDRPSHFKLKKRHFCNQKCYSLFRKNKLPKEEQHRFGTGMSVLEKVKRYKARTILNHAIRDGKLNRMPCEKCGKKSEAHHSDYSKPLKIKWFCFKHHRQFHYENPELLK